MMTIRRARWLVLAGLLLIATPAALAGILAMEHAQIIFAGGKAPENVTWSKNLILTADGLEAPMPEPKVSREVWVQTDKIPVGLAWRPPPGARVRLSLHGQVPKPPAVFVRYGCDGVHWSTWYQLAPTTDTFGEDEKNAAATFTCDIRLPAAAAERYRELEKQWQTTADPAWASDEDELCRWIAKTEPAFFEKEFPFLGYVQFRLEDSSLGDALTLEKLTASMSWGVGGMHMPPKDPKKHDEQAKWHFVIKP